MDLRQLNALLAVAEHRSFSAAARALHTVQSNVSTHVARLERELGAVLIDRARGELSPEGVIVADRARRIQGELRAIQDDLVSMREDLAGTVRMGIIGTTARWLTPVLLDAVHQRHPRLELIIVDATTTSLAPQLVQGQLDVAVVNLPLDDPELEVFVMFEEDRILIAPGDHPLAEFSTVDLATLAQHQILLPPPGTAFRDAIDADARRARVTLQVRAEIDGLRLLTSLAFQGFAPALVPASATSGTAPGNWRMLLVEGLSRRQVGLARSRGKSPSAPQRAVAELVTEVVESEAPKHSHLHLTATRSGP
jgi:LysR family hydrogen peroxide-inducible transcriptional activator